MILHRITSAALLATMATTVYIANSTHEAPLADWVGSTAEVTGTAAPTWNDSYAKQFPTCAEELDTEFPSFLAMDLQGEVRIYSFDEGWERTHTDDTAHDDLWIIGQCA